MAWAEAIYRNRIAVFYAAAVSSLAVMVAGMLTDIPYAGLLAFGFVGLLVVLFDFRLIFFGLLLVLPLSNEIQVSDGLRMYLPTEPLSMLLLVLTVIYGLLRPGNLKGPFWRHPVTVIIALQLLWIAVCVVTSTHPMVSAKYLLAKLWFIVPYYFLAAYIIREEFTFRKVFWLLFLPTIGGIVYVMLRHGATGFLFDEVNSVVRPIFRNHVNYGVWITAMLPLILLARTWYRPDTLVRLFLNFSAALCLAAIYFSYTRGAWVALACMPVFILIVKWRAVRPAIAASFLGILVFAGMMFSQNRYLQYAPDYDKTIYHAEFSDHMTATFQMQDMSTVERFYRWIAAVRMFQERPVTGFGPGNFVNNYKGYTVSAYETYISDNEEGSSVHNYFLTMLTEQGVAGLVLFAALLIAIMICIERVFHRQTSREGRYLVLAVSCCFLVLLVNNVFSDLLEADKLGPLFFICIAVLVNLDRRILALPEELPEEGMGMTRQ